MIEVLGIRLHNIFLAIDVANIQDVLFTPKLTPVPKAAPHIAGLANLRGRIVTAIDMGLRLGMDSVIKKIAIQETNPENHQVVAKVSSHELEVKSSVEKEQSLSVIVESQNQLYSLIVHDVEDVRFVNDNFIEKMPATVEDNIQSVCAGMFYVDEKIYHILDQEKLLNI